jgi:type I restriction enzyme, S subunit
LSFDWTRRRLEDITINLNNKRVPLSSRDREKLDKIYPYYGAQGIIDYVDSYIFDGEYLLVAEDGENLKSRKQNIANIAKGKFWVNNHAHILLNNDLSDLYYLYYYLNSIDISGYITGSVQPKLSKANLNAISIFLPPLTEQKCISRVLKSLDDKIELNNAINKNLEEMAQALFKHWFVDFEFPNENGEPFKSSGGEFEESELGLIPKGWTVGSFEKLIQETIGGDWGKESSQGNYTEKVFCIRGADIPELNKGNVGKIPERYILPKNAQKKSLSHGDIVIEISGGSPTQSTGRVSYIVSNILERFKAPVICTNFCRVIKPKSGYSDFLYSYLKHLYNQEIFFQFENGTTGIKNLDLSSLLSVFPIVIPDDNILAQFSSIHMTLYSSIQDLGIQSEKLSQIRDSLLPKLMSGEIRVPVEQNV